MHRRWTASGPKCGSRNKPVLFFIRRPFPAGNGLFFGYRTDISQMAFFFVNLRQNKIKNSYGNYRNTSRHPLRRGQRPHHHALRSPLVASDGRIVQRLSGRGRKDRADRHRRRGFRQPPRSQYPRGRRRAEDRLSGRPSRRCAASTPASRSSATPRRSR